MKINADGTCITIINRGETHKFTIDEVLYVSQRERRVLIKTENEEFYTYGRVNELEPYFDDGFQYILKYTIVNYNRVKLFYNQSVYFDNGEVFVLGRANYTKAKADYVEFVINLNRKVLK